MTANQFTVWPFFRNWVVYITYLYYTSFTFFVLCHLWLTDAFIFMSKGVSQISKEAATDETDGNESLHQEGIFFIFLPQPLKTLNSPFWWLVWGGKSKCSSYYLSTDFTWRNYFWWLILSPTNLPTRVSSKLAISFGPKWI